VETIILTATLSNGSQEFLSSIQELLSSRDIKFEVIQSCAGITNIIAVKEAQTVAQDNTEMQNIGQNAVSMVTIEPIDSVVTPDQTYMAPEIAPSMPMQEPVIVQTDKLLCRLLHLNHDDYIPYELDELSDTCQLYVKNASDVMGYVKFNFKGCEYNYPCVNLDGQILISCCINFQNDETIYNCEFIIKSVDNEDECKVIIGKNLFDRISTG